MMGACWSCCTIGLGGVGIDGHAVRAVGSIEDCNQARDGVGGWGLWVGGREARLGGQNS